MANSFLDFLQAASNTAADTVAVPVDLLASAFKAAGVPVNNPVGGTAWQESKGLRRPVNNTGARLAGETVASILPIVAAAKAPQIASAIIQGEKNLNAPRQLHPQAGAILFHSSPARFKYVDPRKANSGVGMNANGYGLNTSESPFVASEYLVNAFRNQNMPAVMTDLAAGFSKPDPYRKLINVDLVALGPQGLEHSIKNTIDFHRAGAGSKTFADALEKELLPNKELIDAVGKKYQGNLYTLDVPDDLIQQSLKLDAPINNDEYSQELFESLVYGDWKAQKLASNLTRQPTPPTNRDMLYTLEQEMFTHPKDANKFIDKNTSIKSTEWTERGNAIKSKGATNRVLLYPWRDIGVFPRIKVLEVTPPKIAPDLFTNP